MKKVPQPEWTICIADCIKLTSREIWRSSSTSRGAIPSGGANLHWAAGDRIVFLSYADGWPHLYSVPATGGSPLLLTPGKFMVEQIRLSPTGLMSSARRTPA